MRAHPKDDPFQHLMQQTRDIEDTYYKPGPHEKIVLPSAPVTWMSQAISKKPLKIISLKQIYLQIEKKIYTKPHSLSNALTHHSQTH